MKLSIGKNLNGKIKLSILFVTFIFAVFALLIILNPVKLLAGKPTPPPAPPPAPPPVAISPDVLTISGKDLFYHGEKVVLRGTNFANISALKGVNVGGIGSGNIADIEFNQSDYQEARLKGINHVRFGMSWSWWTNDTTTNKTNFFAVLDQHVAWAKASGIWITPLMFTLPGDCYEGYSEDCSAFYESTTKIAELKNFWVKMAQHYLNEPAIAGLDLINEPVGSPRTTPAWSSKWTDSIAKEYIAAIRAVNPYVLIFITAGSDGMFYSKYTDSKIVYEFHFYSPLEITHNGVFGGGTSNTYPGTYCNEWKGGCLLWEGKETVKSFITNQYALGWANQNNVPVYIGEWGTFSGPTDSYINYQNDVAAALYDLGISHAHYSFKAGNNWGMYNLGWPLIEKEPLKNAGLAQSWVGNIFLNPIDTPPINPPPPPAPVCGNGIKESSEVCDDGNTSNNDSCSSDCLKSCNSPMIWNGSKCVRK